MQIPPLPAQRPLGAEPGAGVAAPPPAERSGEPVVSGPPVTGGGVSVVTTTHEPTGALVTTMVHADTGEVMVQIPIAQVLDLVFTLLDQRQRDGERNDHGQH